MEELPVRAWWPFVALLLVVGLVAWTSIATAGPLDYRIGTDDVLAISVWSEKDLDQVVSVRPDGKISLPLVGETEAGGLTVADLASRLTTLYRRTVPGAQVTVSVREIRSRQVFFLGSVVTPGPIQLTEEMTILQALKAVGGPVPTAELESAFVLRGETRIPADLQKMQEGDLAQNLRLQPGDTVVVPGPGLVCAPSIDCVWVQGAVNAPGPVKYTENLTVTAAIEAAGGFTPYASGRVTIRRRGHRPEKDLLLVITPNLSPRPVPAVRSDAPEKEVLRLKVDGNVRVRVVNENVPLKPNDVIVVPQKLF
jgi:polysaccharide export outer membrane protein